MTSSRYILTVIKTKQETEEYQSVFFAKPEGFIYKPGGIFDLYFPDNPSDKRVFSFASSPTESEIIIGYRKGDSEFKKRLQAIGAGQEMGIRYIGSTLAPLEKKNLFIAGGIGITTFRSMLKYMEQTDTLTDSVLFYINRSDFFPYVTELEKLKTQNSKFKIRYIQTTRHGRLNTEKLQPFIEEIKNSTRMVYISGPPSMVDYTIHLFESLGVDRDLLQTDSFDGYNEEFVINN
jgi:ferredoxin-NADP reductase